RAGFVYRVEQRAAAARLQLADLLGDGFSILGRLDQKIYFGGVGGEKAFVLVIAGKQVERQLGDSVLVDPEIEAGAGAGAGQAEHGDGQVRIASEVANVDRLAVFRDAEIVFLEIHHETVSLVRHCNWNVDHEDLDLDLVGGVARDGGAGDRGSLGGENKSG